MRALRCDRETTGPAAAHRQPDARDDPRRSGRSAGTPHRLITLETETNVSTNIVHIVRHGQNPANITREFSYCRVDYSLTPLGVEQAHQTAACFARRRIAAVYASPLKRAKETADIIATRLDLPVTVVEQFREINVGELEGQEPTDERWAFHDGIFEQWFAGNPRAAFPGGECQLDIHARMRDGLHAAVRGRADEQVIVVAHGGITLASIADLCPEVDMAALAAARNPNCAITTLELATEGDDLRGRLITWAACDHLS